MLLRCWFIPQKHAEWLSVRIISHHLWFYCFLSLLLLALILYVLSVNHCSRAPYLSFLHHIGLRWLLSYVPKDILIILLWHMKAIASSCLFPMFLKSSQEYCVHFLLRFSSTVCSSHILFHPLSWGTNPGIYIVCCMNNSDCEDEKGVQGSWCLYLHLVSLSQSVLGKAMLLDLPFLSQFSSEIFFGLKTPVVEFLGGITLKSIHSQTQRTVLQFLSPALSEEEKLVSKFPVVPTVVRAK